MNPLDRLSYGARGLWEARIVHMDPEVDDLDPSRLMTAKNRRDAVLTLLRELEEEGFIRRWRTAQRRDATGRVAGVRRAWAKYPAGDAPVDSR